MASLHKHKTAARDSMLGSDVSTSLFIYLFIKKHRSSTVNCAIRTILRFYTQHSKCFIVKIKVVRSRRHDLPISVRQRLVFSTTEIYGRKNLLIVTKFWISTKRTDRSHWCPADINKHSPGSEVMCITTWCVGHVQVDSHVILDFQLRLARLFFKDGVNCANFFLVVHIKFFVYVPTRERLCRP